MLLVNPVFSSELLLDLLENVNNLKITSRSRSDGDLLTRLPGMKLRSGL